MSVQGQKRTFRRVRLMSASLIGRSGSSAFRLSTTAVSISNRAASHLHRPPLLGRAVCRSYKKPRREVLPSRRAPPSSNRNFDASSNVEAQASFVEEPSAVNLSRQQLARVWLYRHRENSQTPIERGRARVMLSLSDLNLSLFFERKGRTEGEDSGESSLAVRQPNDRRPRCGTYGGTKAKPPAFASPAALLCLSTAVAEGPLT
jgi:hypothetical protein